MATSVAYTHSRKFDILPAPNDEIVPVSSGIPDVSFTARCVCILYDSESGIIPFFFRVGQLFVWGAKKRKMGTPIVSGFDFGKKMWDFDC